MNTDVYGHERTARAAEALTALRNDLAHYWETLHTARHYEDWMRIDLAWLEAAHALLRLPGPSAGADREVALAHTMAALLAHLDDGGAHG